MQSLIKTDRKVYVISYSSLFASYCITAPLIRSRLWRFINLLTYSTIKQTLPVKQTFPEHKLLTDDVRTDVNTVATSYTTCYNFDQLRVKLTQFLV